MDKSIKLKDDDKIKMATSDFYFGGLVDSNS